jgi:ATP-binding cassette, subfamily C, bacterial exporter for protease/lipase
VELFDGTVAENIARFSATDSAKVIEAARLAGVHEMILQLPEGYDTRIGPAGSVLSAGQRQRIGLARAVYGSPAFVVLDEPDSNLDEAGEQALVAAITALKSEAHTVLVVTHRVALLSAMDKLLVLRDGQVGMYGPRDKVLAALSQVTSRVRPLQAQYADRLTVPATARPGHEAARAAANITSANPVVRAESASNLRGIRGTSWS